MIERHLRALCMWWFSELHALVPVWIWKCVPRRPELVGVLCHAEFTLLETSGDRKMQLLRVRHDAREFNPDLAETLLRLKQSERKVSLQLKSELGLTKLLRLPVAAIHDLDQLLRFELDRLSPFPVDEIQFAHSTLRVDAKERSIVVMVQIVPRSIIERALAICKCLGLQPKHLELAGGPENTHLNLLPRDLLRRPRVSWLNCGLGLLALVFAGSLVLGPLQKREATAARLEREIVVEKEGAERSAELLHQLDLLTSTMRSVIDRQKRGPMFTLLVAELTRLMPDDTYVTELRIEEGKIIVLGYSESASNLIGLLEGTLLFGEVKFISPITRDQQSGREGFQIMVALKGE